VPDDVRTRRQPAGWEARFVIDDEGTARAPTGDTLLLVRVSAADAAALRVGDTVRVTLRVAPIAPVEAVGGFPMLLTNGELASGLETAGAASFRGLNPRTAIGIAANGRRLLLAVIDGRQPGVSAGMTTAETAHFMRALGADDALNLDGGGSSALVVWDAAGRRARLATRPSDPTGERAVGNALAVVDACPSGQER
jgi:exopolysaccharide biosynthesis protein